MSQKAIFSTIALTCLMSVGVHAWGRSFQTETQDPTCCGTSERPMRVTARHIEAKGVGYNQGYTTVEGFFSPVEPWNEAWVPFMDLRGHVFNNGKMAANGGLGVRYITGSRVWGGNAYYDYRNTARQHYNQVSVGFESLGKIWDFRINGYLPVGDTKSSYYHRRFDKFKGNNMYVSRKRQFAMRGANAEVGAHVDSLENFPFYFAAGPYYLEGQGHRAWGGELRAAVDIFEYVRLEGNTSYDNIFKWIGQGQVSVNFRFGGKRNVKKAKCHSCSTALALSKRALQRVDRNEIIPIDKQHKSSVAIDPATGDPYFFIFVDNTSHSLGTFESPYPTLLEAQNASSPNDVIYVFPGDGTSTGMNAGITLQNGQMLLGASVPHPISTTVGKVVIPPMASTMPSITNTTGDVVTLANNNTVSGFLITANVTNGIAGASVSNLTATENTFLTTVGDTNGIFLTNPTGTVNVGSSSFNGFSDSMSPYDGNGVYVLLNNGGTLDTLSVSGSSFSNISDPGLQNGGCGLILNFQGSGGTINNCIVTGSTFSNISNSGTGIYPLLRVSGSTITNMSVSDCTFNNFSDSLGIYAHLSSGATITNESFSGSTFSNFSNSLVYGTLVFPTASFGNVNFSGCTFSGISNGNVLNFEIDGGNQGNASVSGCTFSNISNSNGVLYQFTNTAGTIGNASVSGCTFNGISHGSHGVRTSFSVAGTISDLSISGNTFSNISDTSMGINTPTSSLGTIPTMDVSGNTFTGPSATAPDYAASINISSGTTCLNFTNNNATPASSPDPYLFTQSGAGIFNRTTGSDSSTNTGQIDTVGTVGAPGSCEQ